MSCIDCKATDHPVINRCMSPAATALFYCQKLALCAARSLPALEEPCMWLQSYLALQTWQWLLQVPLAIAALRNPSMIKDRLYSTSPSSTTMLAIASGYFVHDLVICTIQLSTWRPVRLLHALFCSLLYCYGLFSVFLHYYGKHVSSHAIDRSQESD